MIDLYTWTTPNGRKISIALEELGLPYKVIPVNLQKEEQFSPAFTAINPNQKIPAIVDHDVPGGPLSVFESGAILVHLAEKTGRLLPKEARGRATTMQWLMYQMSHVGPIIGQTGHFVNQAPEKIPTRSSASSASRCASSASSTRASRAAITSRVTTRSPTSPPTRGSSPPGSRSGT